MQLSIDLGVAIHMHLLSNSYTILYNRIVSLREAPMDNLDSGVELFGSLLAATRMPT